MKNCTKIHGLNIRLIEGNIRITHFLFFFYNYGNITGRSVLHFKDIERQIF